MFVELSKVADVSLGYKSLQNDFYYVNEATIATFGIESRFLTPIFMLRSLNADAFWQELSPSLWLFNCRDKKGDLRGTGALRYIDAKSEQLASEKKQSGKTQTIQEALEAQGGGLWYAPKARPNRHHIWLRKAFDDSFAPFIFHEAALVDQRCNSLSPTEGVEWRELAAALTTSLFAYSLEINGAASMGAGALEAPTTKLRRYPVLDIPSLKKADRKRLVDLAVAVWKHERPIGWSMGVAGPGPRLQALDQWVLDAAGRKVPLKTMYRDVGEACRSRVAIAKDRARRTKKKRTENIGNVAESVVSDVLPKSKLKNFPDDFVRGASLDISFDVDRTSLKRIHISRLLDHWDLTLISESGTKIYEGSHPSSIAEAIVRALMWGRSVFAVGSDRPSMEQAVTRFLDWVSGIEREIDAAIANSALGTGYEDALKKEIYARLGIHPLSAAKTLPSEIAFTKD